MHKYLPSKKFTLTFLSLIIVLGIIYFLSFSIKPKTVTIKPISAETKAKIQEFISLDSDNDNLKDWEEALWKTDPKKADTDGDGASDGAEVNLNRDPLKANINPPNQEPSDKIDPKIIAADKKATADFTALSATEKMGRELFSQYIATRKIDSPLSETDKQQIIESTLLSLPAITFKKYSEGEIIQTPASDNESLKKYLNSLAEILLTNLKTPTESVDTIITDYSTIPDDAQITTEGEQIFQRFTPLITKNKKTVDDMLKLTVPKTFLAEHLKLLNSVQEIYESLDLMQKAADDVVMLIPLLSNYDVSTQTLANSIVEITKKIITLNINFTNTTDYGYIFFNVIMLKNN